MITVYFEFECLVLLFVCVCVRVLGCVIVPVRIFKTSHYPRYPLLFGFRQNAL